MSVQVHPEERDENQEIQLTVSQRAMVHVHDSDEPPYKMQQTLIADVDTGVLVKARENRKALARFIGYLSLCTIVLAVTECEFLWHNNQEQNGKTQGLKAGITALTALLVGLKMHVHILGWTEYGAIIGGLEHGSYMTMMNPSLVFTVFVDILIAAVHSPVGVHAVVEWEMQGGLVFRTTLDEICTAFITFRACNLFPMALQAVAPRGAAARVVERFTKIDVSSTAFSCKVILRERAGVAILYLSMFIVLQGSYCTYVFERGACGEGLDMTGDRAEACDPTSPFSYVHFENAMWNTVVTATGVGYGDIFPITPLGRLSAAYVAICGICLLALMCHYVTNTLIMKPRERRAHAVLRASRLGAAKKHKAANLLQHLWRLCKVYRNDKDSATQKRYTAKFLRALQEFRKVRKEYRDSVVHSQDDVDRTLTACLEAESAIKAISQNVSAFHDTYRELRRLEHHIMVRNANCSELMDMIEERIADRLHARKVTPNLGTVNLRMINELEAEHERNKVEVAAVEEAELLALEETEEDDEADVVEYSRFGEKRSVSIHHMPSVAKMKLRRTSRQLSCIPQGLVATDSYISYSSQAGSRRNSRHLVAGAAPGPRRNSRQLSFMSQGVQQTGPHGSRRNSRQLSFMSQGVQQTGPPGSRRNSRQLSFMSQGVQQTDGTIPNFGAGLVATDSYTSYSSQAGSRRNSRQLVVGAAPAPRRNSQQLSFMSQGVQQTDRMRPNFGPVHTMSIMEDGPDSSSSALTSRTSSMDEEVAVPTLEGADTQEDKARVPELEHAALSTLSLDTHVLEDEVAVPTQGEDAHMPTLEDAVRLGGETKSTDSY